LPHFNIPSKAAAKKGPSAAELTAGMVEAASQGKSQLPVQVKFDLPQKPTLGEPLNVDIALLPQVDGGPVKIAVSGGDGMTVAADTSQFELPAVTSGEVYRQTVNVTPTADGVLMLSLDISLKYDDVTESRIFSVPLIVQR
jgi:hypothetical protein